MGLQIDNTNGVKVEQVSSEEAIPILKQAKSFFEGHNPEGFSQIDQILEALGKSNNGIEIIKTTASGGQTEIFTISCNAVNGSGPGLTMYKQNLGARSYFEIK